MYQTCLESFRQTFMDKTGTKFSHNSGNRIKLFPYTTRNIPIFDLDHPIGQFLSSIEGKIPVQVTADELVERLYQNTDIEDQNDEGFAQAVRTIFFDENGKFRPISIQTLTHVVCESKGEKKLADYLVDVLGERNILKENLKKASEQLQEQYNILEKAVYAVLESKPGANSSSERSYYRIIDTFCRTFEEDFSYILGSRVRIREDLVPLLEFYYFMYTAQACLQLERLSDGDRNGCRPIYFCLEWEKTSQNRLCYGSGWDRLRKAIEKMFAHAVTLEILNQTEKTDEIYDYISLGKYAEVSEEEDRRIAGEIRTLTDAYRQALPDCAEMNQLEPPTSAEHQTENEIQYLFRCVDTQFNHTFRFKPYSSYAKNFVDYCEKYLKNRGRSGKI